MLILVFFFLIRFFHGDAFDELKVSGVCSGFFWKRCYPRVIWSYWDDEKTIQEDVEEMLNISKISLVNFTFIFLTQKNLSDFLNVSSFPKNFRTIAPNHKGEYVRICLLENFGGFWSDSSTYITSGKEMEHVFSAAIKSHVELFGFGNKKHVSINFIGCCKHSKFMKRFKTRLDEILSYNVTKYCNESFCKEPDEKDKDGKLCQHYCFDQVYYRFLRGNPSLLRNILNLPVAESHDRLAIECQWEASCVKSRLLNDPTVRTYPFIKLVRHFRTGKKNHFGDLLYEAKMTEKEKRK